VGVRVDYYEQTQQPPTSPPLSSLPPLLPSPLLTPAVSMSMSMPVPVLVPVPTRSVLWHTSVLNASRTRVLPWGKVCIDSRPRTVILQS
jgi:hypothetical protein